MGALKTMYDRARPIQRRAGDIATVGTPSGEEQWEGVAIEYDP